MTGLRPNLFTLPASWIFRLGAAAYHRAWDREVLHPERLEGRVLSVGNLTVGGTGKTPTVLALVRAARAAGWRPAVLTRGYRGGERGVLRAGAWVDGRRARAADAGDEPVLLSRALPETSVVVGPRRAAGARALVASGNPADLWILDDGFQHRGLARDGDLVLLDAAAPVGNGRWLPAGPLREPVSALRRATAILITGLGPGEPTSAPLREILRDVEGRCPVWRSWVESEGVAWLGPGPGVPVPDLAGHPVLAVSGIARPERFHALLSRSGCVVTSRRVFADHHRFTPSEIESLERDARGQGAVLITTAKDAVRLEGLVAPAAPWLVLEIRIAADPGWSTLLETLVGRPSLEEAPRVPLASPAPLG